MPQASSNNREDSLQVQPGDWIETHASDVHLGGIKTRDASEPVIEALNNGKPINLKDLKTLRQAINETEDALRLLKEELEEKGLWHT